MKRIRSEFEELSFHIIVPFYTIVLHCSDHHATLIVPSILLILSGDSGGLPLPSQEVSSLVLATNAYHLITTHTKGLIGVVEV